MKPPARILKRKRSFHQDHCIPSKSAKSLKVDHEQSPTPTKSAPSPPRDTTSETSGLTSADEIVTVTSATGIDSEGSKRISEGRRISGRYYSIGKMRYDRIDGSSLVEANRTSEIVTAYRNAMEVLVEIANRNRCRAYNNSYSGFGSPAAHYPNGLMNHYATPYATPAGGTYTTPYSNPGPTRYVTPYANSPSVAEAIENSQANQGNDPKTPTIEIHTSENHLAASDTGETTGEINVGIDNAIARPKETANVEEAGPLSLTALDGFLALANGGVLPGRNEDSKEFEDQKANSDSALFAPPSPGDTIDEALSRSDDDVLALVESIAKDLMNSPEPPLQAPPPNPYAAFYSSMNGKQLGAEFKRLVDVVQPEINAIMPREQIQAAHLFYTHLVSCIHTRNAANIKPIYQHPFGPPHTVHHWSPAVFPPPPTPPNGYMLAPIQWHHHLTPQQLPQSHHSAPAFVPRGNVIVPPVKRDFEEERKAAGFGFPPVPSSQQLPSSRTGLRSGSSRGKRKSTSDL